MPSECTVSGKEQEYTIIRHSVEISWAMSFFIFDVYRMQVLGKLNHDRYEVLHYYRHKSNLLMHYVQNITDSLQTFRGRIFSCLKIRIMENHITSN